MAIANIVSAGLAGEKFSRTITGTDSVCTGRSVVATGAGAVLGAASIGLLGLGAASVATTVAAPVVVLSGAVALVRSLFD